MNEIRAMQTVFADLLAKIEPANRKKLARQIAVILRQRNMRRIAAGQNPDGSAFKARSPFSKKRGRFFPKIGTSDALKIQSSAAAAVVHIPNGRAAKIANIHHQGLSEMIGTRGGKTAIARYPARKILTISQGDEKVVDDVVVKFLRK